MRSLIVGASGQVGNRIMDLLGVKSVLAASRSGTAPYPLHADLSELATRETLADDLIRQHEPAVVYCPGAMTDVDACESDPETAMKTNCLGPAALARAAARFGIPFVYFSSDYVFDGLSGPYAEDACPHPISAYGHSKSRGEQEVQAAHPNALIVRTTVVYGPDPGARNFVYRLRRSLERNQTIHVPCDQISTPTYSEDLARATIELVRAGATGTYHVSGPETLSRLDFAIAIARSLALDSSKIVGIPTATLRQAARRPLQAGLICHKLRNSLPAMAMRGVYEAICDWNMQSACASV